MARFLIVGGGECGRALERTLREEGNVVVGADRVDPGELRRALEHVAIVCWLTSDASPERFLLGAVDSSMRGFVCATGPHDDAVLKTAARNSIPAAILAADPGDPERWLAQARTEVWGLLRGPPSSPERAMLHDKLPKPDQL